VRRLIENECVRPRDVLVLLRTDYNKHFSRLIEHELERLDIESSDPDAVGMMLAQEDNRRLLAAFRLLVNREDSLAWATLLHLTPGIGDTFVSHVYDRAVDARTQFGAALLAAHENDFNAAPTASGRRASEMINEMSRWLDQIEVPAAEDGVEWGEWIVLTAGAGPVPAPTADLSELLVALDENAEAGQELGRFLGQIWPLGEDRARAESAGVRIMTMGGAKGLTVRAAVVAALEDEIIPRQEPPLDEERRLLYVALTRAREYVYGTWARRRTGPTARVGGGAAVTRRSLTRFLRDGPVASEDGERYIRERWPADHR
jgi:DNA helicase-2/ATP-dependent DNA helicase PcrA